MSRLDIDFAPYKKHLTEAREAMLRAKDEERSLGYDFIGDPKFFIDHTLRNINHLINLVNGCQSVQNRHRRGD